ncbi:MAG: PBP1 and LysM peptidoglycan-binding domain-containing protein [Flavicella sp.]
MRKFLFLCFVVLHSCMSNAQSDTYTTYTVKEGETIRDIGKRIGVKTKVILKMNPGLQKKPEANTLILIPKQKAISDSKNQVEREHVVLAKETLFGISQLYSVSIESLYQLNPTLKADGLKIGAFLKIPSEKVLSLEAQKALELEELKRKYLLHTVVKDDTMYSLTRFYEISESELLTLNPELSDGLKLGMHIKIKGITNTIEVAPILSNTTFHTDSIVANKPLDIAMLLPFKFSKNDTLSKSQLFSNKNNLISIVTDFYLGAEIAIDSLRSQGVKVNVNVYDTSNNKDSIQAIIDARKLDSLAVIFGPLYSKNADLIAASVPNTPVVFPFYSNKQSTFKETNLIKTATPRSVFKQKVVDYFKSIYTNENIIVVGDEKIASKIEMLSIVEELKKHDSIDSIAVLQPVNGYISNERFVEVADTLGTNWVLLATNDKVVTADVVNNMKSLPNTPKVKLFAIEKKGNFEKVNNNLLGFMEFVYAASSIDVDSLRRGDDFHKTFLKKNKTFPSDYAIRGFDVVYDVLMRLLSLNISPTLAFSAGTKSRVKSSFHYKDSLYVRSIENNAAYLYQYTPNLKIRSIDFVKAKETEKSLDSLQIEEKLFQVQDSIQPE